MRTDPLNIATYNIHACVGMDGRFMPERIVQVLREIDADVIALQEVEHHAVAGRDLPDYLAAETGMTIVCGSTLLRDTRHYGNAVLTRLPIRSIERIDLSVAGHEPRGALGLLLDWHGRRLHMVATHLGLRPGERRQQVRRLLALYDPVPAGLNVLLGDINEWLLWGRPLRWLRQRFAPVAQIRTFPARFPLFALDRIWVQPHAALLRMEPHRSRLARIASDHLPLKAQLVHPPVDTGTLLSRD